MSVWVLEIEGRGILAFPAETGDQALAFVEQPWLQDDLLCLESGDAPLWDGEAELFVRDPFVEELDRLGKAAAKNGDRDFMVYLVPVNDPTNDDGA